MDRLRAGRILILSFATVLSLARVVHAQDAGIAGIVKDATGAVLPGVTVTASSPVLIEQQRVAITDAEGRYVITQLRPGTYSVSFSLAGFSPVVRQGIIVTAGFTANVEADLRVGALTETVTVTGASPVVDVQNVRRQTVVTSAICWRHCPSARRASAASPPSRQV